MLAEPLVRVSEIVAFISWKLFHSLTKILQLMDKVIMAAANRGTGSPLAMCTNLFRNGYPLKWSSEEILRDWSCWLNQEKSDTGRQPVINPLENPLGTLYVAPTWLAMADHLHYVHFSPGRPPSDVSSLFSISSAVRALDRAAATALSQFRDRTAQLQSMYPETSTDYLSMILNKCNGDVSRAITVMVSLLSLLHEKALAQIVAVPPAAPNFAYSTGINLQGIIDAINNPTQPSKEHRVPMDKDTIPAAPSTPLEMTIVPDLVASTPKEMPEEPGSPISSWEASQEIRVAQRDMAYLRHMFPTTTDEILIQGEILDPATPRSELSPLDCVLGHYLVCTSR